MGIRCGKVRLLLHLLYSPHLATNVLQRPRDGREFCCFCISNSICFDCYIYFFFWLACYINPQAFNKKISRISREKSDATSSSTKEDVEDNESDDDDGRTILQMPEQSQLLGAKLQDDVAPANPDDVLRMIERCLGGLCLFSSAFCFAILTFFFNTKGESTGLYFIMSVLFSLNASYVAGIAVNVLDIGDAFTGSVEAFTREFATVAGDCSNLNSGYQLRDERTFLTHGWLVWAGASVVSAISGMWYIAFCGTKSFLKNNK